MVAEGAEPGESPPILATFVCCCASATWTKARAKPTSKMMMAFLPIPACLLRFVAGCLEPFSLPLFIRYGIAGNRATDRIRRTSHPCCIASSRLRLEHPRPHALCCDRLSARESSTIDKVKAVMEKHLWYANQ